MTNENTPYIGENGNWYINDEDTGMRSQGDEGPQGPVGPQGLIGPKGKTGDRGPQGIQGPVGATGAQGSKGDKGDTGERGPKGDTPELVADLQTTVTGKALDATMGKVLDDKIKTNTTSINSLNSKLTWKMFKNVAEIGLNNSCTMDQIISALTSEGYAMLITPMFKSDFPNVSFAGTGMRHLIKVECPFSGYVAITDYDISNGVSYFRGHDGNNYTNWSSTNPI
ncbi:collagen triple helix repeat protein [Kineothrix alysoides]|uniref:Collagen triple helix repeat protein n=1 Tax=Kineothrix alysoides TaxID=1469948 RepID=A0A4R1R2F0_9FIRM|nr:collagen-like protein [Kineothrix alysoides]TCL59555.1 collagen triple helix repeat protein [Kineothrix alysoides]